MNTFWETSGFYTVPYNRPIYKSDSWYIYTLQGVKPFFGKDLKAYYKGRNEEIRILCGSI